MRVGYFRNPSRYGDGVLSAEVPGACPPLLVPTAQGPTLTLDTSPTLVSGKPALPGLSSRAWTPAEKERKGKAH